MRWPADGLTVWPTDGAPVWPVAGSPVWPGAPASTPPLELLVFNLRDWFNTRNSSAVQPGAPDHLGTGTSLVSLADSADSWAPYVTTTGVTANSVNSVAWYAELSDLIPLAPLDYTLGLDIQVTKRANAAANWFGAAFFGGDPTLTGRTAGIGRRYTTFGTGIAIAISGAVGGGSGADLIRGLVVPWPGSVTCAAGVAIFFGRNAANQAVSGTAYGQVAYGNIAADAPTFGVCFGSTSGALTNAGGDVEILVQGTLTDRSKDDGGAGWLDLPFPGGAPTSDAGGLYVSDTGAHATDWGVGFNGNFGNTVNGHTPVTGTARMRYVVAAPDGLNLALPIVVEIVATGAMSTSASIVVGVNVVSDTDGNGCGVVLNQLVTPAIRSCCWSKSSTNTGTSYGLADRVRGVIALNAGTSGTVYHGAAVAQIGTATGPASYAGSGINGSGNALVGAPRLEVVIHNWTNVVATLTAGFRVRLRNIAVHPETALEVAA